MTELQQVNYIRRLTPVDVTGIVDQGMRALTLYAVSMGWNARQKGQVILTSRGGHSINLPSDTSVRRHYMASNLRQIMTHTEVDKKPTIDLVEQIMAAVKLTKEAEREFREITGVGFRPKRPKLPEPPPIPAFRNDGPKAPKTVVPPPPEMLPQPIKPPPPITGSGAANVEVPSTPQIDPLVSNVAVPRLPPSTPPPGYKAKEPTIVSREPFRGKYMDAREETVSNRVEFSDGTVKYECIVEGCGWMTTNPRSIGGHRVVHIKRGEVQPASMVVKRMHEGKEAAAALAKIAEAIAPYLPASADPEELESLRAAVQRLTAQNEELVANLADATEERDRLRTNLTTLRELLGDVG